MLCAGHAFAVMRSLKTFELPVYLAYIMPSLGAVLGNALRLGHSVAMEWT